MMEVVSNSGGLFWNCAQQRYVEAHNFDVEEVLQHPFILGATPETALQHLSWTTTLFQYSQPRMYPKPAEQKLLSAAIRGLKDEELSCELGVSLSFIKKTWSSIYNRAAEKLPELNLEIAAGSISQRGKEKNNASSRISVSIPRNCDSFLHPNCSCRVPLPHRGIASRIGFISHLTIRERSHSLSEHQIPYFFMRIRFGSYSSLNFFLAPDLAVRNMDDHSDYLACLISDECDTSRVTRDEEGIGTLRKQFRGCVVFSPLRE